MWEAEKWLSVDIHVLIPEIYKYVILHGKKNFEVLIKLSILRLEYYLQFSEWVQCKHEGPNKEAARSDQKRQ